MSDEPRWWSIRPAQNLSASVYTCPLCDQSLPALAEHVLIAPEDDTRRRRHAHTDCVRTARRSGDLPSRDEWRATQPPPLPWWRRLPFFGR